MALKERNGHALLITAKHEKKAAEIMIILKFIEIIMFCCMSIALYRIMISSKAYSYLNRFIAELYSSVFISLLEVREDKHLKFKLLIFIHATTFRIWYLTPGLDP